MSRTLLVAVDPDAHAEDLVARAVDLAAALGAGLLLLHVLPVKAAVDPDVLDNPAAHPAAQERLKREEALVAPRLRALARSAVAVGVPVRLAVAHGEAADTILRVAGEEGVDIVMLWTHGRRGIARLALGSVAEAVVRESPAPVLTVRAGTLPPPRPAALREIPLDERS